MTALGGVESTPPPRLSLQDWIESETSGDYKKTLLMLAGRNSEENLSLAPVYWAQRCHSAKWANSTEI